MLKEYIAIDQSEALSGTVMLDGAKNAVLVIIASLILTKGTSVLHNVPDNADVRNMIDLLRYFGAHASFDLEHHTLTVDTSNIDRYIVNPDIMNQMRASILVMGPLLARFGKAHVALPGGCLIGARPINYHLYGFKKMGVIIDEQRPYLITTSTEVHDNLRIAFEYPSVGATENLMMFACSQSHETLLINVSLEPEVLDLMDVLKKMGAQITVLNGTNILIKGGYELKPITYHIIPDRLEAGSLLLAACITKGNIHLPNARADHMDLFLDKLKEMGHLVAIGTHPTAENPLTGISLVATSWPMPVSLKTAPYPGFPTDLQAPTMAALCLANGTSVIEETVFENRLVHVKELQKLGGEITIEGNKAFVHGVDALYGTNVIATDIRASSALVIAGLAAQGTTQITGIHHWRRGYNRLETKLNALGASIEIIKETKFLKTTYSSDTVAESSEISRVISD